MGLKIWHQSFTVLQDLPAYLESLKQRIAMVVRPRYPGNYAWSN